MQIGPEIIAIISERTGKVIQNVWIFQLSLQGN